MVRFRVQDKPKSILRYAPMADHRFHISVLFCAVGFEQCRLLSPSSHPPPNQHGSPKGTIVLQKGTIPVLGKVTPKAKFAVGKLEAHRTGKRPPCLRLPFSNWGSFYQGLMGPLGVFRLKASFFRVAQPCTLTVAQPCTLTVARALHPIQ